MNDDFEKIAKRMERDALRVGGPTDTPISVPCKACGQLANISIRRFTQKRKPRCPNCRGHLDEEVARKIIVDAAVADGKKLLEVLKKRSQQN